jgi:Kef-type K+ transport system membrane component KefB
MRWKRMLGVLSFMLLSSILIQNAYAQFEPSNREILNWIYVLIGIFIFGLLIIVYYLNRVLRILKKKS